MSPEEERAHGFDVGTYRCCGGLLSVTQATLIIAVLHIILIAFAIRTLIVSTGFTIVLLAIFILIGAIGLASVFFGLLKEKEKFIIPFGVYLVFAILFFAVFAVLACIILEDKDFGRSYLPDNKGIAWAILAVNIIAIAFTIYCIYIVFLTYRKFRDQNRA